MTPKSFLRRWFPLVSVILITVSLALASFSIAFAQDEEAEATEEGSGASVAADVGADQVAAADAAVTGFAESFLEERAPILLKSFLGIEFWRLIAAALVLVLVLGLRRVLMNVVLKYLRKLTEKTETDIDDHLIAAFDPPIGYFIGAFGIYAAILFLHLPPGIMGVFATIYRITVIIIVGWALMRSTTLLTMVLEDLAETTESELDDYLVPLVGRVLRVLVVGIILVLVLQEFGFNVGGILAGLGVGGLAFALAAQDTLANWFGALMIYTDRPFEIGDWIKTASLEGVVEEIGLRSTKIRTFSKTIVSVPNSDLAGDTIENFSKMPIRRIYFTLGITYATTPAMMKEAVERVKDILRHHPGIDQSFWLVKFTEFGDSSLNILVYCFTQTTNWEEYLAIREEMNLQIMEKFSEIGVEAAFPSRSIYMESPDPEKTKTLDARAKAAYRKRGALTQDIHVAHTAPSEDASMDGDGGEG